jgi:class 3 adenylate cyclase
MSGTSDVHQALPNDEGGRLGSHVRLLAIVFTEIPEQSAAAASRDALACLESNGGQILQRLPEFALAVFESATDCIRACAALPSDCRAGASCGDVLVEGGFVHGLPVVEASRLKDRAAPGAVLCAGRLVALAGVAEGVARPAGLLELKGLAAPVPAFELARG